MAEPVPFREANTTLVPAAGVPFENVLEMPVHAHEVEEGITELISCWRLTTAEIAEITRTGVVWLRVLGNSPPPICLEAERPFVGGG